MATLGSMGPVLLLIAVVGCGADDPAPGASADGPPSSADAPPRGLHDAAAAGAVDASAGTPDGPAGVDRLAAAVAAAAAAAAGDPRCNDIAAAGSPPGFYWEIGDGDRVLASGARGSYSFATVKTVASATKVLTAAYFVERLGGLTSATSPHLDFTSGYVVPEQTCPDDVTVAGCHAKLGGDALHDAAKVGHFHYGPDHMQKLAVTFPDLAALDAAGLAAEYARVLGLSTAFTFKYPALASGVEAGPALFREFLQKLVRGDYRLRALLGSNRRCTRDCGAETSTPVDEPWHYSVGHWVEDGKLLGTADGAFMGLGATGFYIWVDASRRYYGLLGRWALPFGGDPVPEPSAFCGQQIRAAFLDTLRRSAARCGAEDRACDTGAVCCAGSCASTCD